jgi:nucleoside-diphosphate-sugar epimerase
MDITYAKKVLNYKPKVKLEDGIKKEIEWIKENPDAWNIKPRV